MGMKGTENDNEDNESEDNEIVFNKNVNRSNSSKSDKQRLLLSDFADEYEVMETSEDPEEASMRKFAQFLEKNGYIMKVNKEASGSEEQNDINGRKKAKNDRGNKGESSLENGKNSNDSESEITVYRGAVLLEFDKSVNEGNVSEIIEPRATEKRISSSSEEEETTPNTSGDSTGFMQTRFEQGGNFREKINIGHQNDKILYQQFLDCRLREQRELVRKGESQSQLGKAHKESKDKRNEELSVEERMRHMVQQAKAAKAKIYKMAGKEQNVYQTNEKNNQLLYSVVVDEDYAALGAHIDELLCRRIIAGEYVDFSRLIPKDRVSLEADKRLEIVSKNGQMLFQPAVECKGIGITNIFRWQQAFRVYCNIYTEIHAHRAPEMLQYSHIIHHANQLFVWENVYKYDIDFHIHMAQHPEQSWGIILQQAWSMRL